MVGLQMKLLIKKHSENMRGTVENKHSDNIKVCLHLYIIEKTEHDHFRILMRWGYIDHCNFWDYEKWKIGSKI